MKIINVTWFTQMGAVKPIGIIVGEDGEERKAYIGVGSGLNEEMDIQHIAETGAKISVDTLERVVEFLTKSGESKYERN